MASCEKCWSDSTSVENYHMLLKQRKDNPCTKEEQAGENAKTCPNCKRKTIHQYAKQCVICGFDDLDN